MVRAIFKSPPVVWQGRGKTEGKEKGREEKNKKDLEGFFSPSASLCGGRFFLLGDTVKVIKNTFLTQHEIYNINSNCKIIKSQEKYFN